MQRCRRAIVLTLALWIGGVCHAADLQPLPFDPTVKAADGSDLTEQERSFQKSLSGATLVGSFTITGQGNADKKHSAPLREERYKISRIAKLGGDVWRFDAQIQYGDKDVTVPVPLYVRWAGDTPMVQVTNLTIPGLGNGFTARVLFHETDYAGTWRHGKVTGHMFGRIEREKEVRE